MGEVLLRDIQRDPTTLQFDAEGFGVFLPRRWDGGGGHPPTLTSRSAFRQPEISGIIYLASDPLSEMRVLDARPTETVGTFVATEDGTRRNPHEM